MKKIFYIIPIVIVIYCCYRIGINHVKMVDSFDYNRIVDKPKTEQPISEPTEPAEKLNVNTATREELIAVHGIGEVRADEIIKTREEIGGFLELEQLAELESFANDGYKVVMDYLTVE